MSLEACDFGSELQKFKNGQTILKQGTKGSHFYIIQSGSCEVSKKERGKVQVLATLGPKDFFGEKALMSNEKRGATIKAMGDYVECLVLSQKDFHDHVVGASAATMLCLRTRTPRNSNLTL